MNKSHGDGNQNILEFKGLSLEFWGVPGDLVTGPIPFFLMSSVEWPHIGLT